MNTSSWKLKDIIMVAIIGVLFSFLYLGAVYVGAGITTALTPSGWGAIGYEPIYGIWYMAAAFACYVIRKPGTGVVAEVIAATLEVLMGNMFGPMVIVTGIIQGLGIEIGFMIFKYKKFDLKVLLIAASCCTFLGYIWNCIRSQYYLLAPQIIIVQILIRWVSALLFAAVIVKILADALAKAGVLNAYPIGQALKTSPDDED